MAQSARQKRIDKLLKLAQEWEENLRKRPYQNPASVRQQILQVRTEVEQYTKMSDEEFDKRFNKK